jgi:hypothetical protein
LNSNPTNEHPKNPNKEKSKRKDKVIKETKMRKFKNQRERLETPGCLPGSACLRS